LRFFVPSGLKNGEVYKGSKSEVKKEGWRGVTCVVRKKSEREKEKEKEGGVVWCVMLG
jgi:hypothetical protein